MEKQVVSKKRVADYGEVLTGKREVNAILDLVALLKKNTQNALRGVYSFVPMQDLNEGWTDAKLYRKYGLTKDEIAFIESMVRPMEVESE